MQPKTLRTKALWMFVISYIVMLCFPLVFSQIVFSRAVRVTEDNTRSLSEITLVRTQDSIARIFTDIRAIGRELASRPQATSLLYASQPLTPVKLEKVSSLQEDLRAKVTHNQYISEIYMYFSAPQIVASTREYQNSREAFERTLRSTFGIDFDTFDSLSRQGQDFQLLLLGAQRDKLVVMATSSSLPNQPDIVCLFHLYTERFRQMLGSHADNSEVSLLWMTSPEGQVFAPRAEMALPRGQEMDAAALYAAYQADAMPSGAILLEIPDAFYGWGLYSAVSAEQYRKPLRSIQVAYVAYLAVCLTLGLGLAVLFSRRHYRPIHRFAQMLKVSQDSGSQNEYAALQDALGSLIQREAQSSTRIREQQHALRQAALARVLRGKVTSPAQFEALTAENGLHFSTRRFLFIGISIRDAGRFFQESARGREEEGDEELLRFLIVSVMEELLHVQADGYAFSVDEQAYCLVSPREDSVDGETFLRAMADLCAQAGDFIAGRTGIRLSYYLSALYENARDYTIALHEAAQDVQWGMEQIEGFQLEDGVLTRGLLEKKHSALLDASGEYLDQQLRSRFTHAVLSGDFDEAAALYAKLHYSGPFPSEHSFANVQINSALLLSLLAEEAFTPAQLSEWKGDMHRWASSLRHAHDLRELDTAMRSAAREIYQKTRAGQGPEHQHATFAKVMEYIAVNYADPMLSVGLICEHFKVSSSYLLKLFKRHGQSGVLDAIQERRVEAAKDLLRTTRKTVAQIAEEVGYTNTLALNRAFKRTEGITPSEYRNLIS